MRMAFLSTYCVLLCRFQLKFKVKPSLVFGACGGALSGFLAGVFEIGGLARSIWCLCGGPSPGSQLVAHRFNFCRASFPNCRVPDTLGNQIIQRQPICIQTTILRPLWHDTPHCLVLLAHVSACAMGLRVWDLMVEFRNECLILHSLR